MDPEPAKEEAIKAIENAHGSINSTRLRATLSRGWFVQKVETQKPLSAALFSCSLTVSTLAL